MKHFKLFFALFAMLAFNVGNAWAEEVTFNYADYKGNGTQSSGSSFTMEKSGMLSIGNNKFYGNTNYAHFYANGTITITPATGVTITKIVLTASGTSYNGYQDSGSITASTGTMSKDGTSVTWTGSASSAFTLKNNKQIRWTKIVVTYTGSTTQKQKYTLTYQAGSVTGSLEVEEGANLLDALKDITPEACDPTSTEPIGWSESEITTKQANGPTLLTDASIMPSNDHNVYYVFAKKETIGGDAATEKTGTYTFSNYTAGTQNAKNEEHKLDDDVTIYTNDCHFTSELRIYSSSSNNGYVISNELPGRIISMDFNMGYKKDVLVVYGSTNGSDWTLVGSIATTATTYKDYTLSFEENNYTYFKLDVYGDQQIRIAKMSITYMSGGGTTTISDYTTSCSATPDVIVKTLESIAVSGMTTEYVEGDEFTFDGTCTATYRVTKNDVAQDDETQTVTPTVSAPNMTKIGEQTVTVSYTDGEVTAETSYTINITEKPKYTITWNNAGTTNTTKVVQGEAFGTLPEEPADCDNGKKFMGWTSATEVNNDGSGIVYVKETDIPTGDKTYYAVFAVVEGEEGTPTTATVTVANYATANSWTTGTKYTTMNIDANITATATGGGNTGKYYSTGNGTWRFYQNETPSLTIAAAEGYEIQTVKVTYTVDKTGVLTLEGSNVSSGTVCEINAASVTFSVGNTGSATNGQAQVSAIEVVYASAAKKSDYSLDCTINTTPEWTIETDEISFADKYVGVSYTETFTISASNLTDDIALAIEGSNFTVSPTSISKDATFPQTVTVTYAPTAAGSHNATLNITSGSTLSKSIALTGSAEEATIYTLTALADIKPTDKVIIVGTSGSNTYAMSNDKGTSDAPAAVAVTVADNKIATNETNILWNIAKDGDNLTIYPADQTAKWLYCLADANDGVRVGTGNAKEFTIDKGYLYTTQTTTPRHIGIYSNSDWRCYKPSGDAVGGNIAGQSFAFYVLPDTKPSISVSPASKDFEVLTVGETAIQEFEITALNITQALTAELTGDGFTKSDIVDNKITITFAPTEVKEYSATLTISAGTEASVSVTLEGEGVAATYSVTYDKNGAEGDAPTDETKYVAGSKVTVAGQNDMTMAGYRFAGWKYGENIYKAGAKFTMPAEDVTFVAQWVEKEDLSTGYWVLVTDASKLNADDYVVIAAADYNVAMKSYETGNNCKQVEVTKVNNLLTWNENVGVFRLDKSGENYTFQDVNTEQYLYAAGGTSSNYLRAADEIPTDENAKKYSWTISVADNKATIKAQIEDDGDKKAHNWLRYNNTESGKLFSCYDANSSQKDIALYKYQTTYTYTRAVTSGDYGTICLPYGSSNYTGAEFYEVAGKEAGKVVLDQVTELIAGVPYIFKATANVLEVVYKGEAADASNKNGLYGTFTNNTPVAEGNYIIFENELRKCGINCHVNENRAYLVLSEVPSGVSAQMPGRKRVGMAVTGENGTTDLDNIVTPNGKAIKVLHNGQIIIIRNGEKFNAQGQKL